MKTLLWKFVLLAILLVICFSIPVGLVQAEGVDFSCMNSRVKAKAQVSTTFKEYDVALENHCPGAVYWSMCIERMDPWTNELQVGLTPSGKIEAQKKSRVNLQVKKRFNESNTRYAYQKFYANVAYALKPPAKPHCAAKECEVKKRSLRAAFRNNDAAWYKAKKAQEARMTAECPQSSWDGSSQEACEAKIREGSQATMDQFAQKEKELKNKLWSVDPERCMVHGVD